MAAQSNHPVLPGRSETKSLHATCLSVRESTAVRLKENIPPFATGTVFVYRCEEWYYPDLDWSKIGGPDGKGESQLWYLGATKEEVPRWMYALLLLADFYKGADHRLKELFELETKEGVTDLRTEDLDDTDELLKSATEAQRGIERK